MNGSERARNVLRWIDHVTEPIVEQARKACRGRKDVERLRTDMRLKGWPENQVRLMTEAAQHKDLEFMVRWMWLNAPGYTVIHPRRAVLR